MSGKTVISVGAGRLVLLRGDLTLQDTAAIVNAANSSLLGGGGVDGAIHRAGGPAILEECRKIVARIGRLEPGGAVITTGGRLKARWVIHTVGPVWRGGTSGEDGILLSAYRNSLRLAAEKGLSSVAFPSISTGAYRFPVERAAGVAADAFFDFLDGDHPLGEVRMVLWSGEDLEAYRTALLGRAAERGFPVDEV